MKAVCVATVTTAVTNHASGVVRIETTAGGAGGVRSGFLVVSDVVAAVAHVAQNARTVAVRDDEQDTAGVVVGLDGGRDLALLRLSHPLPGHLFALASTEPDVGTTMAAIDYPLAGPRCLSGGTVSGLNRAGDTDTAHLTGLRRAQCGRLLGRLLGRRHGSLTGISRSS